MIEKATLALEDGTIFEGRSIGAQGSAVGEVVFNTSMTGYQEILTDPSYSQQLVTLTYPHIGNVGVNRIDEESNKVHVSGLIIRDASLADSSWRSEETLSDYLRGQGICAIADIDTRQLTKVLRTKGAQKGCIVTGTVKSQLARKCAQDFAGIEGMDLASVVGTLSPYKWESGDWSIASNSYALRKEGLLDVVAYDFGVKRNILRLLVERGCNVTVVPPKTPASEVLDMDPDGVFLSNGPGDPAPCTYAIDAIQIFLEEDIPIFGICLGFQLLGLACGARTKKMKFGHHGANHPVQDVETGGVMITSQNHGFALDIDTLPKDLIPTHVSLFDGSLQGMKHSQKPAFGFQGHPEASPGPHDVRELFDTFLKLMTEKLR